MIQEKRTTSETQWRGDSTVAWTVQETGKMDRSGD